MVGLVETVAAIGTAAPLVVGSPASLAAAAGATMALVMAGAMATHLRRAEYQNMVGNAVWLAAALPVAYANLADAFA